VRVKPNARFILPLPLDFVRLIRLVAGCFRAAGTGAHERSVGGHGTGPARLTEAGRRFRGVTDTGTLKPHERKHPATRRIKRTKSKGKGKMKRALGFTRTG